jgi:hypothetical protein
MAKSKTGGATNSAPARGKREAAAERQVLANETIGEIAGQIWQLLDSQGAQSVPAIRRAISAPDDVIFASIGWLAREDKLSFSKSGRSLTISLR